MTVIVVTHNSTAVLGGLLASLDEVRHEATSLELIVVDSGSVDGAPRLTGSAWADSSVISLKGNRGFAAGINAGLAHRKNTGPVLILNADVRLAPGALSALLATLDKPGVGIAVPRLVDHRGHLQHSLRREPTVLRALVPSLVGDRIAAKTDRFSETVRDAGAYDRPTTADWATGAVMLISNDCLRVVGRWDDSFFLYSEETDFALRARDAGYSLMLTPEAVATHIGGESATSEQLWSLLQVNRVRLYRKRHGVLPAQALRAALIVGSAFRAALGRRRDRYALTVLLGLRRTLKADDADAASVAPGYIWFSAQDWWYHNRSHSDFQLMRGIAANRRVLCVNSIGMRMPSLGKSTRPTRRILRKALSIARFVRRPLLDLPNFYVMTPLMIPLYGSTRTRTLSAWLVRLQVGAVARTLRIADRYDPPVVIVTIPTAWDVVRKMPKRSLVLNRSDRYSAFPEVDRNIIEPLERNLLRAADHVLYVSRALMDEEQAISGDRAFFLDHGVDLHHFGLSDGAKEHPEIARLPKPRIGFFGGFDDYIIDFDLLVRLAREIPDASLVLIGDATCSMALLEGLPNVYWLGYRPYTQIPALGTGFDVAIMPWLDNEWIRYCNPIKAKEYLALGLPVVTTPYPEASFWTPHLDIADNADNFVKRVRAHLGVATTENDRLERRAAVAEYSWDTRAAHVVRLAESISTPSRQRR